MSASILPLALENVSYASNGQRIIEGVSLAIEAGPSTIILGANGAGKSVLMRLMHGLLQPSAGRVRWNESDSASLRRRQAMVFQRPVMLRRPAASSSALRSRAPGRCTRKSCSSTSRRRTSIRVRCARSKP
jgi:tungstate transport system ATP-binding protein